MKTGLKGPRAGGECPPMINFSHMHAAEKEKQQSHCEGDKGGMRCSVSSSRFDPCLVLMAANVDNQGMMLERYGGLAQSGGNDSSLMVLQAIYTALALRLMAFIPLSALALAL